MPKKDLPAPAVDERARPAPSEPTGPGSRRRRPSQAHRQPARTGRARRRRYSSEIRELHGSAPQRTRARWRRPSRRLRRARFRQRCHAGAVTLVLAGPPLMPALAFSQSQMAGVLCRDDRRYASAAEAPGLTGVVRIVSGAARLAFTGAAIRTPQQAGRRTRLVLSVAHGFYRNGQQIAPPSTYRIELRTPAGQRLVLRRQVAEVIVGSETPETVRDGGRDWALLRLRQPLPDWVRALPLSAEAEQTAETAGGPLRIAGYPYDRTRRAGQQGWRNQGPRPTVSDCRLPRSAEVRGYLWRRGTLGHTCDVADGNSGSPILMQGGNGWRVVGVHRGMRGLTRAPRCDRFGKPVGTADVNFATRLTPALRRALRRLAR